VGNLTLDDVAEFLKVTIARAELLNEVGNPNRSRELSLAITNAQQALHWLEKCPRPAGES
jgi:hypothetical protein